MEPQKCTSWMINTPLPPPDEAAVIAPSEVFTYPRHEDTHPSCHEPAVDLALASRLLARRYEVIRELGQGSMGVVYLVRDKVRQRMVVVKMLQSGYFCNDQERAQFRQEIEMAIRLKHPGVVGVHEAGEVEGCPYYCMDYIDGPSLARRLREGLLPGRDAACVLLRIAQAVQHAHQQGILHRDLKPSNILLAPSGPCIIDFGLARKVDEALEREHGAIIGTPLYMAPEQASGRSELMGPAADIYSLGAILYELLTGRTPFAGTTLLEILQQVLHEPPIPPTQLNPDVPSRLEAICLRCLEKEPQLRYPSAKALIDDLKGYLFNQPDPKEPNPEGDSSSDPDLAPARTGSQIRRCTGLFHAWDVLLLLGLAGLAQVFYGVPVFGRLLLSTLMILILLALGRRRPWPGMARSGVRVQREDRARIPPATKILKTIPKTR